MSIDLKSDRDVKREIKKIRLRTTKAVAAGVYALAASVMDDAKDRAPKDTTALAKSGFATIPDQLTKNPTSTIGFGGRAKDYAVIQHEDTSLNHPNGGEAKYLENAINAHRGRAESIIAKGTREAFAKDRGPKRDPKIPTNPFADGPGVSV